MSLRVCAFRQRDGGGSGGFSVNNGVGANITGRGCVELPIGMREHNALISLADLC